MRFYRSGSRRSGFEELFHKKLPHLKFESAKLEYIVPAKKHKYTPDFYCDKNCVFYETKGRFTAEDRKKMKFVVDQNPEVTIIMVFQDPNRKLTKAPKSKTYWQWCEANGIKWKTLKEVIGDDKKVNEARSRRKKSV